MQRKGLIKALPFHKHLPVMKVCEHQVQWLHTFCRVYEFCMDKKMMTVQIMVIFCQLRLVSERETERERDPASKREREIETERER